MAGLIRIGIVGCGRIAERNHIPGYLGQEGCVITALCDVRTDRMEERITQFPELKGAACFEKDADLFASGLVDAVSVCTPNDCHHPQTLAACQAGLHVHCEKPMAATLEHATEMIEAARKAGVVLQINQSFRFNAQYRTVVELVKEGAIGTPFHVRCIRAGNGTPNKGWSPGADWFVQKKHNGGLLLDIGIHMADLLRMIMGDAEKVAGLVDTRLPDIDVPDNVRALFRFRNGGTGVLELSWTLPGGAGFLEVYGTGGRIRVGFDENPIQLWQAGKPEGEALTYPDPKPRENSQGVFLKAVRGEAPTLTPGEYGRRALALCLAILESSDTGVFASVPHFDGEDRC
ncbi:MAG: Gfo/Idh/MocA family oxidoreductase [Kiritimatiellaeota bacterium]|nr:Gfo/Idh/MocA family oxidoreductase [Kiritimatiellota bacterium]